MLLSILVSKLQDVKVRGMLDREIEGVTENATHSSKEIAFAAIRGAMFDGMDFIDEARAYGARVFVCEKDLPANVDETVIISKNPRKTMAEILNIIYLPKISRMKIVGITGTKGKTTTLKILSECISSCGIPLVSIGTLGAEFYSSKKEVLPTENTTPSSPFIYKTLIRAYNMGIRIAVIEVSSQALASYRVHGIPFIVCIFTNISPDHIGAYEHKTFKDYAKAKRSLFLNNPKGVAIVNSTDPLWEFMTNGTERVIKVGKENCDFKYEPVFVSDNFVEFILSGEKFKLSVGGDYNGINASLAITAASFLLDKSFLEFQDCLEKIKIPGRYEVYYLNGIKIIIDFAHNEKSFTAICENAKRNTSGRLIVLFGSVGGRCRSRRSELASVAEKYADLAVITADNPGFEPVAQISSEIYSHFKDKTKAVMIEDRKDAIYYALNSAKATDSILLLGKGQECYQKIGNEKLYFSEREILIELGAEFMG